MRRKDIVIIGLTALVAGFFSFVLSSKIFGSPKTHPIKVPVVQKIDPQFPVTSSSEYTAFFNPQAINPTQLIHIGDDGNKAPFNSQQGR